MHMPKIPPADQVEVCRFEDARVTVGTISWLMRLYRHIATSLSSQSTTSPKVKKTFTSGTLHQANPLFPELIFFSISSATISIPSYVTQLHAKFMNLGFYLFCKLRKVSGLLIDRFAAYKDLLGGIIYVAHPFRNPFRGLCRAGNIVTDL